MHAQVQLLSKQQGVWHGQDAQGAPSRRGSDLEEDSKLEVEEEMDAGKIG